MLRRKQRIRLERGKERAESVGDKMERKKGLGKKGVGRGVSGFLFSSHLSVCLSVCLRRGRREGGDKCGEGKEGK